MADLVAPDLYDRYYTEKIWAMIPEVYRTEDGLGPQQNVLRGIVEVLAQQAAETRRSIDRLWEDQNIDTCDDWAVPYIGDLVATRLLSENDPRARRVDVAQTVRFRRRRGTPSLLEELVRELSGWDAVLVEAFRRLGRTPHRLDNFPVELGRVTRTPRGGTANLVSARSAELAGTAFDEFFRTPDPRLLAGSDGRINLGNVNFHLFRLIGFETPGELAQGIETVNRVTPATLVDVVPPTFTVDPSGRDTPLFSRGEVVTSDSGRRCTSVNEWEVAREIPCRLLSDAAFIVSPSDAAQAVTNAGNAGQNPTGTSPEEIREAFRTLANLRFRNEARLRQRLKDLGVDLGADDAGAADPWYRALLRSSMTQDSGRLHLYPGSVRIELDPFDPEDPEDAIQLDAVMGADLSVLGCVPVPSDPGVRLLVDPARGRFTFPGTADPEPLVLRYFYGFSGSVGAGTYPRTLSFPVVVSGQISDGAPLVLPAGGVGTFTIEDSVTYTLDFTANVQNIVIQARGGQRPYVKLVGTGAVLTALPDTVPNPDVPAKLTLDGVWLAREELGAGEGTEPSFFDVEIGPAASSPGEFDWDEIHITHSTFDPGGLRADGKHLPTLRIVVTGSVKLLRISQSIVGPIEVVTNLASPELSGFVETLEIIDSVVDAHVVPGGEGARQIAIRNTQGDVRFEGVTVFGDIVAERILGTDSIVMGRLVAGDTGGSCFRFGVSEPPDPEGDQHVPDRFHAFAMQVSPHFFVSRRFGDPGYALLSTAAPEELRNGAEDGSEMGAFSTLKRQIRLGSVVAKVDEFKPVGILSQYIFEGEEATTIPFVEPSVP